MLLWDLFSTFFLIGAVSFGGGYAMIPLIQEEVVNQHAWMTHQEFTDAIAIAGMSPGPISTNTAIYIGYDQAGFVGATVSAIGMLLPSVMLILAIGILFYKIQKNKWFQSAFYGLRPIISGMILYAAFIFASQNGLLGAISWHSLGLFAIFAGSLMALMFLRIPPVYVLLLSGVAGIVFFY